MMTTGCHRVRGPSRAGLSAQGRSACANRSRCHQRPLNRHARDRSGSSARGQEGLGPQGSVAATIAAASSAVGAGLISTGDTLAVAPVRGQFRTARVRTIMSWNVRFSLSQRGQSRPR